MDLQLYLQQIEDNKIYAMQIPRSSSDRQEDGEKEFIIFDEDLQRGNLDPWILMGIYNRMADDTKIDRIRAEKLINDTNDAQNYVSYFFRFGVLPEFFTDIPSNFHYNAGNYIPDNFGNEPFTKEDFINKSGEMYKYCGTRGGVSMKNIGGLFLNYASIYLEKNNIIFSDKQLKRVRLWEAFDFLNWYLNKGQVKNITDYIDIMIIAGEPDDFQEATHFEFVKTINVENKRRIQQIREVVNLLMIASGDTDIWSYICSNPGAVSDVDIRLLASNSGIDDAGRKSYSEICNEAQNLANARISKHLKNREKGCNNENGISLEPVSEIPPELLFTFTQNGKIYCEDITMLVEIIKEENPLNPYTREPFDNDLVKEIQEFAAGIVSVVENEKESVATLLVKLGLAVNPYFPSGDFGDAPEARVLEFVRWMRNTGNLIPFDTENIPLVQKKINLLESLILETMIFGNGMVKWKIYYGFGLFFNAVYFELMKLYTLLLGENTFNSDNLDRFLQKFMEEVIQGRADTYRLISINTQIEMVLPTAQNGDLSFDAVTDNIIKMTSILQNPDTSPEIIEEIKKICGIVWM